MAQTTTDTPTVGAIIRAWRLFRGLGRKAFAEKAGVRPEYVSEIENDKKRNPWLGQLEKLAAALEISLQDIQDRRLPPGQGEGDDQSLGQGPLPGMAQAPQPQATAAVGPVLQQLLEQLQALNAAVSQLQADVADLKQTMDITSPDTGQEPLPSEVATFNPVRGFVEAVIEEVIELPDLDKPHSGRVILTYLVEEDVFGEDRELEECWLAMLERVIAKGWDILHFIWLNENKNRVKHLERNLRFLHGRRGNYKVYFTKDAPLGHGLDFVAVDAVDDSLKRAFEFHALDMRSKKGQRNIKSGRIIRPPAYDQINNILDRLKRWEGGEWGFEPLLSVEHLQNLLDEKAKDSSPSLEHIREPVSGGSLSGTARARGRPEPE